jgi:tubulin polyglutamylase TTLL6/13
MIYFVKIYLAREGMVRFCTKKYEKTVNNSLHYRIFKLFFFPLDNIDEVYMHLTNYAINKNNSNYVRNEDIDDEDKGSKRTLSSVMKFYVFIFFYF